MRSWSDFGPGKARHHSRFSPFVENDLTVVQWNLKVLNGYVGGGKLLFISYNTVNLITAARNDYFWFSYAIFIYTIGFRYQG